jgi:hypothetical protein
METGRRSIFTPNVVIGLAIVLFGVVLLLEKAGVVDAWALFRYWPVLLILFGVSIIWQAVRADAGAGSLPKSQPPIVTPGLVLLLVFGALFSQAFEYGSRVHGAASTADEPVLAAVAGKVTHTSHSTNFRGAKVSSMMGRSRLDLRDATIAQGGDAVVDVFALMGRVDVVVPDHWIVEVEATPFMGKVQEARRARPSPGTDWRSSSSQPSTDGSAPPADPGGASAPSEISSPRPRLVIRGFVMMSAVEIVR